MRDALYRVCEAYYDGSLSKPQVMALLARSQDLTAAVLSVEQLTGAVAARQVGISGAAGANSSAFVAGSAEQLVKLQELQSRYEAELKDAKQRNDAAKQAVADNAKATLNKQGEIEDPANVAKVPALKAELEELKKAKDGLVATAEKTQAEVDLKQKQIDTISKAATSLEQQLGSGAATAAANASGTTQIIGDLGHNNIDKDTAKAIATAVENITQTVLNKNYVVEECMAALTNPIYPDASHTMTQRSSLEQLAPDERRAFVNACLTVIQSSGSSEAARALSQNN